MGIRMIYFSGSDCVLFGEHDSIQFRSLVRISCSWQRNDHTEPRWIRWWKIVWYPFEELLREGYFQICEPQRGGSDTLHKAFLLWQEISQSYFWFSHLIPKGFKPWFRVALSKRKRFKIHIFLRQFIQLVHHRKRIFLSGVPTNLLGVFSGFHQDIECWLNRWHNDTTIFSIRSMICGRRHTNRMESSGDEFSLPFYSLQAWNLLLSHSSRPNYGVWFVTNKSCCILKGING